MAKRERKVPPETKRKAPPEKKRKTPFGPEVGEHEPPGGSPKPPPDRGEAEVGPSGLITGTGREAFEKLFGPYPTNEILREQGWPPRAARSIQVTYEDAYEHFIEAGLPPGFSESDYRLACETYLGDAPWATTGAPQFAAVQHVGRRSGRGEVRWISKFPDARTPNDENEPWPYWEGPPASIVLKFPETAVSTFQIALLDAGVEIPDERRHHTIRRAGGGDEEDEE